MDKLRTVRHKQGSLFVILRIHWLSFSYFPSMFSGGHLVPEDRFKCVFSHGRSFAGLLRVNRIKKDRGIKEETNFQTLLCCFTVAQALLLLLLLLSFSFGFIYCSVTIEALKMHLIIPNLGLDTLEYV